MKHIQLDTLLQGCDQLSDNFNSNSPFPHIVVNDFLDSTVAAAAANCFPNEHWKGWYDADHVHQRHKMSCDDTRQIPETLRELIYELNSGPFLKYLSQLTGIENLLPDPFLTGGGLHLTRPGGTLTPHIDFHQSKGLPLYRRLNLLIYLQEDWQSGDGGELELWDNKGKEPEKCVAPTLATMVLFRTDAKSLHGFTNPVARKNRKSIALYYYTVDDTDVFSGSSETYWRSTAIAKTPAQYLKLAAEQTLLAGAKVATSVSWRLSALAGKFRDSAN